MKRLRKWLSIRHTIDRRMAIILIILFSFFITCLMLTLAPIERYVLRSLIAWSAFLMPLLNWLPVLMLMLLVYFIFSNVILSITSVGGLCIIMAVTNRLKLQMRGDPLFHWDFKLIGEVAGIARGFGWAAILTVLAGIVLYILLSVCLARRFRSQRLSWTQRGIYSAACVLVIALGNSTLYSSEKIDSALPVWGSFYNQADVHNSKGNLYAFLYTLNTTRHVQPEGYDPGTTRAFAETYAEANEAEIDLSYRPSIIMIMGEAFSDISESPVVSFDGLTDPLAHFKALGETGIAGRLVVPSRGGGTADTEHDVLTARAARFLRGVPYAYRTITKPVTALPSVLADIGYDTFALHPGYRWFYNRQNIYPKLGFDELVFEDAFPAEAYDGTFITEAATFDQLLAMIKTRVETPGHAPMFGFCLTIQNHAAYEDRFVPPGTVTFQSEHAFTPEETNILSNYFAGIADADAQLARLTDYLDSLDEPFVLVYYGDHLPSLDETLYQTLIPGADAAEGSLVAETRLYTVPFLLWENSAARAASSLTDRAQTALMPENMTITSNYLGAYLLELLGFDRLSPYMRYTNETRATTPVLMASLDIEAAQDYLCWMYDLAAGQ